MKKYSIISPTLEKLTDYYLKYEKRELKELIYFYRNSKSMEAAIENLYQKPTYGYNSKLTRHPHSYQIKKYSLRQLKNLLLNNVEALNTLQNFDEIYIFINNLKIPGIGELTVYDSSFSISSYLNLLPQSIYILKGAEIGYNKLFERTLLTCIAKKCPVTKTKILIMDDLPKVFHKLTPYEIHNFLCAYRDYFDDI